MIIVFRPLGNQLELDCWENVSKEKFCKSNQRKRTLTAINILDFLRISTQRQSYHHIETSRLICVTNQLTGFYMMTNLAFNGLSQ